MGARCSGQCCHSFFLPYHPSEIAGLIADESTMEDDSKRFLSATLFLGEVDGNHFYTCMHYDEKSGDCNIYNERPNVCREFPYGAMCGYDGCTNATWNEATKNTYCLPPPRQLAQLTMIL